MKIIIFYGSYGRGHRSAANAIYNYLQNKGDIDVKLIDGVALANKPISTATTKGYSFITKKIPSLWKFFYNKSENGKISNLVSSSTRFFSKALLKTINDFKPDLIISTHPFCSQMCASLKESGRINTTLSTVITDFHLHRQWIESSNEINYYFVQNENMKSSMIDVGIDPQKIFVTGIPISSDFNLKFNDEEIFNTINLDPDKQTVLFLSGGEYKRRRCLSLKVLEVLLNNYKNMQIIMISSKSKRINKELSALVKKTNSLSRVRIIKSTRNIAYLMHISDVIITKAGGLTISESMASSLPIIIVNPIPGQEEQNSDYLVENGVALWVKKGNDINETITKLFNNPKKLEDMKDASMENAKPNATRDICEILLNNINNNNNDKN